MNVTKRKSLLETYEPRLNVARTAYSNAHSGEKMSKSKEIGLATLLNNINKRMTEAYASDAGTQRSALGEWKKFCMNLTNVAVPNLIAHDICITYPMTSYSGYITYINFNFGVEKGDTTANELANGTFRLGEAHPDYTSERVVETLTDGQTKVVWTPVIKDSAKFFDIKGETVEGGSVAEDGTLTIPEGAVKVAYIYDNVVTPQAKLPTLKMEVKSLPLIAKARRIAIYYNQIAAFQGKQDYGFDMNDQLAEKAVGELSYEIDTEIVQFIKKVADEQTLYTPVTFKLAKPNGITKFEHYASIVETFDRAAEQVYKMTKRYRPNIIIGSYKLLRILNMVEKFKSAPAGKINGPFFAGTIGGYKVFISPSMKENEFVVAVNGDDMQSAVCVYAPYMPIIPTQLIGTPDGTMMQGFSTMYALEKLNDFLAVPGLLVNGDAESEEIIRTRAL